MKFNSSLFALLPILASAAPLLGIPVVVPVPYIPSVSIPPVPSISIPPIPSVSIPPVKSIISSAIGDFKPLPSSIIVSVLAKASASAAINLNNGISAAADAGATAIVKAGFVPVGSVGIAAGGNVGATVVEPASRTGTVSTLPVTTGTSPQLLQYLIAYLNGARPVDLDKIVAELETLATNLDTSLNKAKTDITNGLYIQDYTLYTTKLVSYLTTYFKSLPSTVTSATSFKSALSKLDITLSALISAEKVSAGVSGVETFLQALIANGIKDFDQFATLLPKSESQAGLIYELNLVS